MKKPHGIYFNIYRKIEEHSAMFPPLPEMLVRLRKEVSNPNCTVTSLGKLIQADVAMAAFILKIARSARYASRAKVESLEDAIRRIGINDTYSVALSFFVGSLFNTENFQVTQDVKAVYFNSVKTAAISMLLAGKVGGMNPNKAMLAGLMQDIGASSILSALFEMNRELYDDPHGRATVLNELCPLVGLLIVKSWNFDEEIIDVIRNRNNWMRDHEGELDLTDVVMVAHLHALIGTPAFSQAPRLVDIPAFQKMPLQELTPRASLQIIDQSQKELAEIQQLLTGR